MDFYTNLTFRVQKGRGLGSRDPISKFLGPPIVIINFWTNRAIRFKFGTDIEVGPLLLPDQKNDPKVGVSWVTWPFFEILGPPYNFGTNRDICFRFRTDIDDGPLLRPDHKTTPKWAWPLGHAHFRNFAQISKFGHVTYHVTKFRNFGTSLISLERIESASNLA